MPHRDFPKLNRPSSVVGAMIEPLEGRRLFAAGITASVSKLVFVDTVGGSRSSARSVTFKNTGTSTLSLPAGAVSISGSTRFSATQITTAKSIAPGATFTVPVTFGATALGPIGSTLNLRSNAANAPTFSVTLRGLGVKGQQGSNEPSLQWILDTFQIPVNVGDPTPAESTIPLPPASPNDELLAQMFAKAGSGNVTLTPLAMFTNPSNPAMAAGWYTSGSTVTKHKIFSVPSSDIQTLNPRFSGTTSFDPGSGAFGLFGVWPAQGNRTTFTEDFRNTFITPASRQRMFRTYPLKNANGSVVTNAFVVAMEEANNNDMNDAVMIIRNVIPLADANVVIPTGGLIYQAENATVTGASVSRINAGFQGTGYVDYNNAVGDNIRWSINRSDNKIVTLSFRYANGSTTNRPLQLVVNGILITTAYNFMPTGSWTNWSTSSITIGLPAGLSTYDLSTVGTQGPNIDSIIIS